MDNSGKIIKIEDTWHKPNEDLCFFKGLNYYIENLVETTPTTEDADFEIIEQKQLPSPFKQQQ